MLASSWDLALRSTPSDPPTARAGIVEVSPALRPLRRRSTQPDASPTPARRRAAHVTSRSEGRGLVTRDRTIPPRARSRAHPCRRIGCWVVSARNARVIAGGETRHCARATRAATAEQTQEQGLCRDGGRHGWDAAILPRCT